MTATITEAASKSLDVNMEGTTTDDAPAIVEAASESRQGRPRVFSAEEIAFIKDLFPDTTTERQLREIAWMLKAVSALKVGGSLDERLTWLWSEKKVRTGILARLGRVAYEWEQSVLGWHFVDHGVRLADEQLAERVYKKLLPIALELCRIRPRARYAQVCIDAIVQRIQSEAAQAVASDGAEQEVKP